MSQLANQQGGSFEHPSRPTDPPVVTPQASLDAESQHSQVLSQAKRDLAKAEELIADISGGDEIQGESSLNSFAVDVDRPPGDFAAADPYVNTQDSTDEFDNSQAAGQATTTASSNTTGAMGNSNKEPKYFATTESDSVSQIKPGGVTNLSMPQVKKSDGNVRTVEEMLSTIPNYEVNSAASDPADSKVEFTAVSESAGKPDVVQEVEVKQNSALPQVEVQPANVDYGAEQPRIDAQLASGILKHSPNAGAEEIPISWFAQDEAVDGQADSKSTAASGVQGETESAGAPLSSAIVDPVSGEKLFDVRDFSEMADAKIQPIPNAYDDGHTTVINLAGPVGSGQSQPASPEDNSADETIHSPMNLGSFASQEPAAVANVAPSDSKPKNYTLKSQSEPVKTEKSNPVTNIAPTNNLRSSVVDTSNLESSTSSSTASDSVAPSVAAAGVPLAAAASLAAALSSSSAQEKQADLEASGSNELGKLAKTPKPAPTISDSEIAAALVKCDDIPDPQPDYGRAAKFEDESFGELATEFTAASTTGQANSVESDNSHGTFLIDEGEVIQIDGNDGYEFIDLACFDRSFATVKPGRIIIEDQSCSVFEVHYKNVEYVLFADGVTVDLPPQGGWGV